MATAALDDNPNVCAVFGRLRERFPQASIYNLLCDIEWDVPIGAAKAFGGNVLIRVDAFEAASGYRETLVAGEEPELSVRLRQLGWSIWRLDAEMATHDAAIHSFRQWWRRNCRSGHAFAEGAFLHGSPPERHWVWERNRALIWGILIPLCLLALPVIFWPIGLFAWAIYPLQAGRLYLKSKFPCRKRLVWALFQPITRFPEAHGVTRYFWNKLLQRQARIIEYKYTSS
jgi:GT2 family glycosyltransferase